MAKALFKYEIYDEEEFKDLLPRICGAFKMILGFNEKKPEDFTFVQALVYPDNTFEVSYELNENPDITAFLEGKVTEDMIPMVDMEFSLEED